MVEGFGAADVLRMKDLPVPAIGPGDVLIAVRCAGVGFAEVLSRRNGYLGVQPPFVPGMEVAGRVVKVGGAVKHLSPGDRVCAMTLTGGYAELAAADARRTFAVPDGLDWPVAASLPIIVPTAHALLHELGRVRQGDRVLVNAAAGGTGMVLGQMARQTGAYAVGIVSSAEKAEVARGYGYAEVVTAAEVDAGALEPRSFDLMLDSVGGEERSRGWRTLGPFGMLVTYGNAGGAAEAELAPAFLRNGNYRAAGLSITSLAAEAPDRLASIAHRSFALVADGAVQIDISEIFTLERAADAHREIESRRTTGKIILDVTASSPTHVEVQVSGHVH
jgi:NADPH2:quinone reductase